MYLGLDIGTSSVKGLLQSEDGEIVASHSVDLAISRPKEGYSEQNPQDWINAADNIMSSLKDKAGRQLSQLLGIGLSGQMHGLVALDKADATSNNYSIELGDLPSQDDFTFYFKAENLKMLSGDYDVKITDKVISQFTNNTNSVTYWVALESTSTYSE